MTVKKKIIGVLTSGGDAPGMNAAIRAVVRTGLEYDMRVLGIRSGYNGLIDGEFVEMDMRSVSDIMHRGGTMLYTARSEAFLTQEGQAKAIRFCQDAELDALIVIGGDGSYRGTRVLSDAGVRTIGVPGTIDNDVSSTDYTIGFDTACNIATEAVDRLRDTAQSHQCCSVVEVMGRHAGYLALNCGLAVGASAVLVPEVAWDIDVLAKRIRNRSLNGKHHHIIIVAEGVNGGAAGIHAGLKERVDMDCRLTVLGHIQRGGSPTVMDRINATRMGYCAVRLIEQDTGSRIVGMRGNDVVDYPLEEALAMKKELDLSQYEMYEVVAK